MGIDAHDAIIHAIEKLDLPGKIRKLVVVRLLERPQAACYTCVGTINLVGGGSGGIHRRRAYGSRLREVRELIYPIPGIEPYPSGKTDADRHSKQEASDRKPSDVSSEENTATDGRRNGNLQQETAHVLLLPFEPVADATHRHDPYRMMWVILNRLSESADVNIDCAFIPNEITSPCAIKQLPSGEREPAISKEKGEQLKLPRSEWHFLPVTPGPASLKGYSQIAGRHGFRRNVGRHTSASSQEGSHPRLKFAQAKWLGEVIIGADLKAQNPIYLFSTRGEHHDRDIRGHAHAAADLKAVKARKHDIQHDQLWHLHLKFRQRVVAIGLDRYAVALPFEIELQCFGQVFLILDNEYLLAQFTPPSIRTMHIVSFAISAWRL
jgi:hypothetical protein